mmetsp:Transcript_115015/g.200134  ORF Transcript_115015/g.200134 Transcript_115015/m.200134 type:complete len:104 (+) Transcript_115015:171-482(+)
MPPHCNFRAFRKERMSNYNEPLFCLNMHFITYHLHECMKNLFHSRTCRSASYYNADKADILLTTISTLPDSPTLPKSSSHTKTLYCGLSTGIKIVWCTALHGR